MTATSTQPELLNGLDFHPACDYHQAPNCTDLAVWIVWSLPCTCGDVKEVRYFCGPCWAYRNSVGTVRCPPCGSVWPCMALIRRVERI